MTLNPKPKKFWGGGKLIANPEPNRTSINVTKPNAKNENITNQRTHKNTTKNQNQTTLTKKKEREKNSYLTTPKQIKLPEIEF